MRHNSVGCQNRSHGHQSDPLTGECTHCSWETAQASYPAVVKAYQNHLRENHHDVWVRS